MRLLGPLLTTSVRHVTLSAICHCVWSYHFITFMETHYNGLKARCIVRDRQCIWWGSIQVDWCVHGRFTVHGSSLGLCSSASLYMTYQQSYPEARWCTDDYTVYLSNRNAMKVQESARGAHSRAGLTTHLDCVQWTENTHKEDSNYDCLWRAKRIKPTTNKFPLTVRS